MQARGSVLQSANGSEVTGCCIQTFRAGCHRQRHGRFPKSMYLAASVFVSFGGLHFVESLSHEIPSHVWLAGSKIAQVFDNPWLMGDGPRARQRLGPRHAVLALDMFLVLNCDCF